MTLIADDKAQGLKFYNFVSKTIEQLTGSPSFQLYQLAGDASSRKYYRIVSGDKSWVLMDWEPFSESIDNYPLLSVLNHFEKHKIHTPKIVAKSPKNGLLIQEDLGDLTLERRFWENQNQETIIPFYKQAIDELIKIHYLASQDKTDCHAFKIEFDTEKLLWEMNYAYKNLLEELCGINFSTNENEALQKSFKGICEILNNEEKFISHRDYHSRNLMIKLGQVRVIDFQDARLGPIQYDLVSLLKDSYVDLNPHITEKILKYYLNERSKVYSPIKDLSHFNFVYEIQSIQRCFKACGSFASFFVMRKDTRYLKYIHGTLKKVKDSLEKNSEYNDFLTILDDYKVFDKHFSEI